VPPAISGEGVAYPAVQFRGESLFVVAGKAGLPAKVTLRHVPVARYTSSLGWELRSPQRERLASDLIRHGETGDIEFTPTAD
jgi:hypothetical protein